MQPELYWTTSQHSACHYLAVTILRRPAMLSCRVKVKVGLRTVNGLTFTERAGALAGT